MTENKEFFEKVAKAVDNSECPGLKKVTCNTLHVETTICDKETKVRIRHKPTGTTVYKKGIGNAPRLEAEAELNRALDKKPDDGHSLKMDNLKFDTERGTTGIMVRIVHIPSQISVIREHEDIVKARDMALKDIEPLIYEWYEEHPDAN